MLHDVPWFRRYASVIVLLGVLFVACAEVPDVEDHINGARTEMSAGQYEEAIDLYDQALAAWNEDADYSFTRSEIEGERERAHARHLLTRAEAALAEGDLDEAEHLSGEVRQFTGDDEEIRERRNDLRRRLQDLRLLERGVMVTETDAQAAIDALSRPALPTQAVLDAEPELIVAWLHDLTDWKEEVIRVPRLVADWEPDEFPVYEENAILRMHDELNRFYLGFTDLKPGNTVRWVPVQGYDEVYYIVKAAGCSPRALSIFRNADELESVHVEDDLLSLRFRFGEDHDGYHFVAAGVEEVHYTINWRDDGEFRLAFPACIGRLD